MRKEKPIEPEELTKNFNIIDTNLEDTTEYGRHFLHAKFWTEKILKLSLILNACSVLFLIIGVVGFVTKPLPSTYATTELGTLYALNGVDRTEALKMVSLKQAENARTQAPLPLNSAPIPSAPPAPGISAEDVIKNSNAQLSTVPTIAGPVAKPRYDPSEHLVATPLTPLNNSNNQNTPNNNATSAPSSSTPLVAPPLPVVPTQQ